MDPNYTYMFIYFIFVKYILSSAIVLLSIHTGASTINSCNKEIENFTSQDVQYTCILGTARFVLSLSFFGVRVNWNTIGNNVTGCMLYKKVPFGATFMFNL